jgi:hypothetical protein
VEISEGDGTIRRQTTRRRSELVERSFAHMFDRGRMRGAWLRGRGNIHERRLIHVAYVQSRRPDAHT